MSCIGNNKVRVFQDKIQENNERISSLLKLIKKIKLKKEELASNESFIRNLLANPDFKDGCNLLSKTKNYRILSFWFILITCMGILSSVGIGLSVLWLSFSVGRLTVAISSLVLTALSFFGSYKFTQKYISYDKLYADYNSHVFDLEHKKPQNSRAIVDIGFVTERLQDIITQLSQSSDEIEEHRIQVSGLEIVNERLIEICERLSASSEVLSDSDMQIVEEGSLFDVDDVALSVVESVNSDVREKIKKLNY